MFKKIITVILAVGLLAGCSGTPSDPADNLQNFQESLKTSFNKSIDRIEASEYMFTREESIGIVRNSLIKDGRSLSIIEVGLEFAPCPVAFDIISTLKESSDVVPLLLLSGNDSAQGTVGALTALASEAKNNSWIVQNDFLFFVTDVYEDTNVITIAFNSNGEIAYHSISLSKDDFNTTVDKMQSRDFKDLENISTVTYIYGDALNQDRFEMSRNLGFDEKWWFDNFTRLTDMNTFDYSVESDDNDGSLTPVITSDGEVLLAKEKDDVFTFFTLTKERYNYNGEKLTCQAKN